MEIGRPRKLTLAFTITTDGGSSYDAYSATATYYRGDRVYSDPADGGDGRNYELEAWKWDNDAPDYDD